MPKCVCGGGEGGSPSAGCGHHQPYLFLPFSCLQRGRKMLRAIGLAGLCPPNPTYAPSLAAVCGLCQALPPLHTSHVRCGQAPHYLVRRRRRRRRSVPGRFSTLSLAARHITQRPTSPPCSPLAPRLGLVAGRGGGLLWLGAEMLGVEEVPWLGTSLAGWRPLLCTTPSPGLLQPILFVRVSLYYVSAYKSTLLWAGGGGWWGGQRKIDVAL